MCDQPLKMEVDTGANTSVISASIFLLMQNGMVRYQIRNAIKHLQWKLSTCVLGKGEVNWNLWQPDCYRKDCCDERRQPCITRAELAIEAEIELEFIVLKCQCYP